MSPPSLLIARAGALTSITSVTVTFPLLVTLIVWPPPVVSKERPKPSMTAPEPTLPSMLALKR
jgi:hypothetical protein